MLHITIVNINLVGTNKQEMGLSIKWTYFLIGLDKIVMIEFKSILLSAYWIGAMLFEPYKSP